MIAVNADSALVVDCPRGGVKQATALLNKLSLAQFDVVVTHQDMDHCEGVQDLLRLFGKRSTTLYMNPVGRPRPQDRSHVKTVFQGILSAVEEVGASTADAVVETVGNTGSIGWSVLAPRHVRILEAALLGDVVNRLSVVVLVRIRSFTFLIPGDIDDVATRELLTSGTDLSADVFLLPHHGAKLTTINQLLAAVDPDCAVISAGRRKTHPDVDTLRAGGDVLSRRRRVHNPVCAAGVEEPLEGRHQGKRSRGKPTPPRTSVDHNSSADAGARQPAPPENRAR